LFSSGSGVDSVSLFSFFSSVEFSLLASFGNFSLNSFESLIIESAILSSLNCFL